MKNLPGNAYHLVLQNNWDYDRDSKNACDRYKVNSLLLAIHNNFRNTAEKFANTRVTNLMTLKLCLRVKRHIESCKKCFGPIALLAYIVLSWVNCIIAAPVQRAKIRRIFWICEALKHGNRQPMYFSKSVSTIVITLDYCHIIVMIDKADEAERQTGIYSDQLRSYKRGQRM